MARSAATLDGRYTEDEVLAVVHGDVAQLPDVRIEVYDRNDQLTDIEIVAKECYIDFDSERTIHTSMTLVMEPVERMREALYQYVLSPLVGIGPMPDGGTAWHRWGKYLWTRPSATVLGVRDTDTVEDWAVTLGDLNHLLNMNGPSLTGFVVDQDWLVTTAIQWAAMNAGISDLSRIAPSDVQLTESINWSLGAGPRASYRLSNAEYAQAYAAWSAAVKANAKARKKNPDIPPDPEAPARVITRDLENKGIRWLDVLDVLLALIGYCPAHRDMEGRLVGRPAPNLATDLPTIQYRNDRRSVILPPLGIEPDISGIANVVYVVGNSDTGTNPTVVQAVADLDALLPYHPLGAKYARVRIEDVIQASQPLTQAAADAQARSELYSSIAGFETVKFDTPLNPQHEGFEILALQVDKHADFNDVQLMTEKSWRADLMRGLMSHECARAFRPIALPYGGLAPTGTQIAAALAAWSARPLFPNIPPPTVNITAPVRTWSARTLLPGVTGQASITAPVRTWSARALEPSVLTGPPVAGYIIWYDFSDTTTITDAGSGHVSQVTDKSGNGHTISQTTDGKRPITGTRTINGLNVLDFDGTDDQLFSATFTQAQPVTVFVVFDADSLPGGTNGDQRHIIGDDNISPTLYMNNVSGTMRWAYYAGTQQNVGTPDTNLHQMCGKFNGASSAQYLDGTSIQTANPGSSGWSNKAIRVGSNAAPADSHRSFDGMIAEVIVYPSALSDANRQSVEAYLKNKWGTP